jgi:Rha family phage regulatory protein
MESLVFVKRDQPMTDSLKVSEYFGKQHNHVLRDISELECSDDFRQSNFGQSIYINEQHHRQPKVNMTFDGFMFLAMGYRGKKAAALKERYISEFNHMRDFISVRLGAKEEFKELSEAIKQSCDELHSYHFSNEYDLINRIVLGMSTKQFKKANGIASDESSIRPFLTSKQLADITKLQKFDAGLVVMETTYDDRKEVLTRYYKKINQPALLRA